MILDTARSDAILERLLRLHPKVIDLSLGRIERLLARLDHPERSLPPVVHVAGTNGKGSAITVMRAGIEAAGRSAHVYTSPHLSRFHERIRLAGDLIGERALAELLETCERANGDAPITFFEITTAAALLAFARSPADHCLLEVGLGGRLDATNVVARPALTAIAPVAIDHQQYLGETLTQIAGEKAGILKPGVACVVGPQPDAALEAIEARAARIGAPLLIHGRDWIAGLEEGRFVYEDADGLLELDPPSLPGRHQIDNAGLAVAALRRIGLDDAAIAAAPARAVWPARLQRLTAGPLAAAAARGGGELWLDGGHNAAAGAAIAAHLAAMEERAPAPLRLICGMLETKDPAGFLEPFHGLAEHVWTVPIRGAEAAFPPQALCAAARRGGLAAATASDVAAALNAALAAGPGARVVICGSLYLAGEVLREHGA